MSAVMAEHITSNQHHDPAVGMHYMWNGSVDVSKILNSLNLIKCVGVRNISKNVQDMRCRERNEFRLFSVYENIWLSDELCEIFCKSRNLIQHKLFIC